LSSSLSATLFLGLSLHLGAKRLGVRIPWRPPGSKIVSRIEIRTSEISKKRSAFFGKMELVCFQDPFRNAPGHHFGRFGMDLAINFRWTSCAREQTKVVEKWDMRVSLVSKPSPKRSPPGHWRATEGRSGILYGGRPKAAIDHAALMRPKVADAAEGRLCLQSVDPCAFV